MLASRITRRDDRAAHLRIGKDAADLAVDLGDDVGRHPGRSEEAEPRHRFVARQSALGDGRHLRQRSEPLARADRQQLDLAVLPLAHRGAEADEHHLDVARDHVGERRRGALVVDGHEFHARERLQQRHVEVAGRSEPVGAVVDLAGPLLGELDELPHARDRDRRMHDERVASPSPCIRRRAGCWRPACSRRSPAGPRHRRDGARACARARRSRRRARPAPRW